MRGMYAAMVSGCLRRWCLLACFALCCPVLSWAAGTDLAVVRQVSSGWDVVYKATAGSAEAWGSRAVSAGASLGDVVIADSGALTWGGSSAAPGISSVTASRAVPWSAVARGAARLLPVVGAAAVGYEVWTAMRCHFADGSISCDPGKDVDPDGPSAELYKVGVDKNYFASTADAVCALAVTALKSLDGSVAGGYADTSLGQCIFTYSNSLSKSNAPYKHLACSSGYIVDRDSWKCVAGTASCTPSAYDGKCATGEYSSKTEDEATSMFEKFGDAAKAKAVQIIEQALGKKIKIDTGSVSLIGPVSRVGLSTSSVTTGPSGSTTVTKTPTYNYTYNTTNEGAKITYNTTNNYTTTVTNTAGDTTTTTTTETDAEEQKTDCDKNPDAVACVEFGEVDDEDVNKVDKSVTVAAESVALPSGCPAPVTVAGYTLSYDAACTFSRGVSPFVIAAAGIMAALIVIRSVQGA